MRLALAALVALALAGSASAGRATLSVGTPHVGDTFTASGCGYRTGGYDVTVYLYDSAHAKLVGQSERIDASGCFSIVSAYTFTAPGAYEAYTFQHKDTGAGSYNQNHPVVDLDFSVT